jgi:hypothetical protein
MNGNKQWVYGPIMCLTGLRLAGSVTIKMYSNFFNNILNTTAWALLTIYKSSTKK